MKKAWFSAYYGPAYLIKQEKNEMIQNVIKKRMLYLILAIAMLLPTSVFAEGDRNSPLYASCGSLDVLFVVDDTGSMSGAITNVKNELNEIVGLIETVSADDYQLGLIRFSDSVRTISGLQPLNGDFISARINEITATSGAGLPEASDIALGAAVSDSGWSSNSRIIVLITDAPPGGDDDVHELSDYENALAHATSANSKSIRISSVHVPTYADAPLNEYVEAMMRNYAAKSDGFYIRTTSAGSGTADAITEVITNCGISDPPVGEVPLPPDNPFAVTPPEEIPEPITILLFGSGAAALGAYANKKRKSEEAN